MVAARKKVVVSQELIEKIKKVPVGYGRVRIEAYFWLGIVSALLLRAVPILGYASPLWAKLAWYASVIGYSFFFMHRVRVSARRKDVIRQLDLLRKIDNKEQLDIVDYHALRYVLWSLSVSKEKLNYMIILVFSAFAVALALCVDLLLVR